MRARGMGPYVSESSEPVTQQKPSGIGSRRNPSRRVRHSRSVPVSRLITLLSGSNGLRSTTMSPLRYCRHTLVGHFATSTKSHESFGLPALSPLSVGCMDLPSTNMIDPTISLIVIATGRRPRVETNRRHPPDETKVEDENDAPAVIDGLKRCLRKRRLIGKFGRSKTDRPRLDCPVCGLCDGVRLHVCECREGYRLVSASCDKKEGRRTSPERSQLG